MPATPRKSQEPLEPSAAAVIVGAGESQRMGAAARKPFLELAGRPVLEHACAAFDAVPGVAELVLVVRREDMETVERWCDERAAFAKVRAVVPGGATRSESVRAGVRWCRFDLPLIAVHDAARPLVEPELIQRCLAMAAREGAALAALPARDTLKHSTDGEHAERTLERRGVWMAQTPQVFEARTLRRLLERAAAENFDPTDEAGLWERYEGPVALVESDTLNIKLTRLEDLELARALLASRAAALAHGARGGKSA